MRWSALIKRVLLVPTLLGLVLSLIFQPVCLKDPFQNEVAHAHDNIDDTPNEDTHVHTHRHSPDEPEHSHEHSNHAPTLAGGYDLKTVIEEEDALIPPTPAVLKKVTFECAFVFQNYPSTIFRPPIA